MGEEKKEEEQKKEEEKKEEAKKEEEEEEAQEIVLKVDMHCEACARKVTRALKGFQGVEEVKADCKAGKVVVKGKVAAADPIKVCQRIQKKSGRKVELISPLPKENNNKQQPKPTTEPAAAQEKKPEPPVVITVVLKVGMHCEACAQVLQKRIRKIKGVESVTTDMAKDHVIVKGVVNPEELVKDVYKKSGKQASIVKEEEEKKDEEKKDEEKKEDEKKAEADESKDNDDDKKTDIKKMEYWPQKHYMEYAYTHAPQMFSDENPNACSIM